MEENQEYRECQSPERLNQEILSDEEAEALLNEEVKWLGDIASSGATGIQPTIKIVGFKHGSPNFQMLLVALAQLPEDNRLRHGLVYMLGRSYANKNSDMLPLAAVMHTEAWVSSQSKEEYETGEFIQPRNDPNRIEAATATLLTFDGRVGLRMHELRRRTDNTIVLVAKTEMNHQVKPRATATCKSPLLEEFFAGYATVKLGLPIDPDYADLDGCVVDIITDGDNEED